MRTTGVLLAVCCLALAASEPLLADLRTDAAGHTQLAAVPADQMFVWLNAAANHTGSLDGIVYHETSNCVNSSATCTQAAEVRAARSFVSVQRKAIWGC